MTEEPSGWSGTALQFIHFLAGTYDDELLVHRGERVHRQVNTLVSDELSCTEIKIFCRIGDCKIINQDWRVDNHRIAPIIFLNAVGDVAGVGYETIHSCAGRYIPLPQPGCDERHEQLLQESALA